MKIPASPDNKKNGSSSVCPCAKGNIGFTLIEMLVAITIAAILGALLVGVIGNARKKADGAKCLSNVRQILTLLPAYAQDNSGLWPRRREPGPNGESDNSYDAFSAGLFPYLGTGQRCQNWGNNPYGNEIASGRSIFRCPSAKKAHFAPAQQGDYMRYGYAYNGNLPNTDEANPNNVTANATPMKIISLSKTMVLCDSQQNVVQSGGNIWGSIGACQQAGANRHGGFVTAGFGDGHAAQVDLRDVYGTLNPGAAGPDFADGSPDGRAFWRGK